MRVIISLTTIPSRLQTTLPKTLDSLIAQTIEPYSIELYLPPSCHRPNGWPAEAMGHYGISMCRDGVIECYIPRDYGPVTKLGAMQPTNADLPDDLIVTVDDDIEYKPTWLETIVKAAEQYPDDAIGFAGWNVGGFLAGNGSYQWTTPPCFCDVIEGWAGAAYRRKFFEGINILESPPEFQFVDDVWISSVLNKRKIKRRLLPGGGFILAQPLDEGSQNGLHTRHDFVELNRHAVMKGFS